MTLLEDLREAELWAVENTQSELADRLRAHAVRLRDMSAIEGETSSVRGIVEMINGGPITPGEPKP